MKKSKLMSKLTAFLIAFTMVVTLIPATTASALERDLEICIQGNGGKFTVTMNGETDTTTGCGKEDGVEGATMRDAGYTSVTNIEHPDGNAFEGWIMYRKSPADGYWMKESNCLTTDEMLDFPIPAMGLMAQAKWEGIPAEDGYKLPEGELEIGIDGNGGKFMVGTQAEEYETTGCGDGGLKEGTTLKDCGYIGVNDPEHPEGYDFLGWYPCRFIDGGWKKIDGANLMTGSEILDWPLQDYNILFVAQWDADSATHEHTLVTIPLEKATFTEYGWTAGKECSECGEVIKAQKKIPAATYVKLNKTKFVDGYGVDLSVTVKDSTDKLLQEDRDYTISRSYSESVGTYKVTVKGKGNYTGTKTLTYYIVLDKPYFESVTNNISTGYPVINAYADREAVDQIYVYRATSKTGTYKYIGACNSKNQYTDKKAVSGKTYYYKLKAVNGDNSKLNSALTGYRTGKKVKAEPALAKAIKDSVNSSGRLVNVTTLDKTLKLVSTASIKSLTYYDGGTWLEGRSSSVPLSQIFNLSKITAAGGKLYNCAGLGDPYYSQQEYIVKKNGISYDRITARTYGINVLKVSKDATKAEIDALIKSTARKYYSTSNWTVTSGKYSPSTVTYSKDVLNHRDVYVRYVKKAGYGDYTSNSYFLQIKNKNNSSKKGWTFVTAVPTLSRLSKPTASISNLNGTQDMKVSWKKVSGANKYEVWKKVGSNGTYKKVKTTTSLSYRDKSTVKGKKYYYKVKAVKTANSTQNSYFSSSKYLTCR